MTPLLPLTGNYAIPVPQEGTDFEVYGTIHRPGISYNKEGVYERSYFEIPAGSYEILFATLNCTEQQAGSVVGRTMAGLFEHYGTMWDLSGFEGFNTAAESLNSLLRANGLDPDKNNYLLIKLIQ